MKIWLLLALSIPYVVHSQQNYQYKNLVLEGGGVRGLAYSGALQVLEQKGITKNIERVAGSSVGSIAGLMISLGYTSQEIDSILETLKIQQFNDGKNIFGKIKRIRKEYGIFKGEKFEKWLGRLIENKTGSANTTFYQLHILHANNTMFKDLYCTATNITKQQLEIFSWENTSSVQVKTAVHISSCIPFYFKPVALDSTGKEVSIRNSKAHFDLYVDGGMLCNYPINIFDTCTGGGNPLFCENLKYNYQTLGLKLERPEQISEFNNGETAIAPYSINSMNNYIQAVMNLMMETLNRKTSDLRNEKNRSIFISYNNISGRPRKTSDKEKKALFNNGVMAAENYLNHLPQAAIQ